MAQVKRRSRGTQKLAATNVRSFRTFLLMSQFEAREIGARIALARNEAGLTQDELAAIATFSKRSLQDYETGVTIPYKHLRELSTLLGKPTEWFLYGDQEQAASPPPPTAQSDEDVLSEVLERLKRVERLLEQQEARDARPSPEDPEEDEDPPAALAGA